MKKVISVLLVVVLVLSISVISFAAKKGDVNNDGNVSAVDALYVLKYIAGTQNLTKQELSRADISGDGNVSAIDARKILRVAAGLDKVEEETTNKPSIGGGDGVGEEPTVNWGEW
jgi:hypothetical protein